MTKALEAVRPARRRGRRITFAVAAVGVAAATMGFALPAQAAVDPWDPDARFISISNRCGFNISRGLTYEVQASVKATGAVWHTWQGNLACNPWRDVRTNLFAWKPASTTSRLTIRIWVRGEEKAVVIDADTNYCFSVGRSGDWQENTSKAGSGGTGACMAN